MTFAIIGGGQLDTGYTIGNSLRFNQSDDPSLTRTPSSTTNRKTFTWSGWVKRSKINGTRQMFFGADNSADTNATYIRFTDDETIQAYIDNNNVLEGNLNTSAKFRDASAWYHIVWAVDTTQATDSNRVKIYVNGSQITSFQSPNYPAQNFDTDINTQEPHYVGGDTTGVGNDYALDGYMAEVHFIDGQQLDASSFGEFDEDSGIWKPIQYTGTHGTNGFYLDFESSGSLGADQSGNGNNFTPTNFASTDQSTDTPNNNFCTINPLYSYTGITFSEGNLQTNLGGSNHRWGTGTFFNNSGKWYYECKVLTDNNLNSGPGVIKYGIDDPLTTEGGGAGSKAQGWIYLSTSNGQVQNNGSTYGTAVSATTNDILMVAYDLDNGKLWVGKNGSWNDGDPSAGTGAVLSNLTDGDFTPAISGYNENFSFNFGSPPFSISSGNSDDNGYGNFEYAPPTGFLALCTQNLATELSPTIDDGSQYFNTVLYTGNGTTNRTVTGVGFQPDWTWFKGRTSTAIDHALFDSNRGATKILNSNNTNTELTVSESLKSFDSDGVTLGNDAGDYGVNYSGRTYALWSWKANGGTTSSNTDGTITSTVQTNTTAGFSIVTYTGNGTAGATIGHGLGVKPSFMIFRGRDQSGGWIVYHKDIGATSVLSLQGTGTPSTNAAYFNNTEPTSSVVTLGYDGPGNETNNSGTSFVAYCFVEIEGYSKFGSYTGNGSTDGTFVYTGFRPAFVIYKRSDAVENWQVLDIKRDIDNPVGQQLYPNLNAVEGTENRLDFTSNGFKFRNSGTICNASGGTYRYLCFAENPFVSSTGIPVVAR